MPSQNVLEMKKAQVAALKERLDASCAGVLVNYEGINVADDTVLRKELREAGVEYTVIKNTIIGLAIDGTDLEGMKDVLAGTTALATSKDDSVAAARILCKYADSHDNFKVKSGFLDGKIVDVATIDSLAKLPTREVLLATVCNAFNAPISALARALQAVVDKNGEPAAE